MHTKHLVYGMVWYALLTLNTESCLYGSAVAHKKTEGESLEHLDTGTITRPLHPVTQAPPRC